VLVFGQFFLLFFVFVSNCSRSSIAKIWESGAVFFLPCIKIYISCFFLTAEGIHLWVEPPIVTVAVAVVIAFAIAITSTAVSFAAVFGWLLSPSPLLLTADAATAAVAITVSSAAVLSWLLSVPTAIAVASSDETQRCQLWHYDVVMP
jgi:hypothetical protein